MSIIRRLLDRFPPAAEMLRHRRMRRRYPNEFALLHRTSLPKSPRQSVVLFTVHKCASVHLKELLNILARDSDLVPINYEAAIFNGELNATEKDLIYYSGSRDIYPPQGYCFAPFRAWHAGIPHSDEFRIILMLRDPRDVLVSYYFSMAFSHKLPSADLHAREDLLSKREEARQADIDTFVLEKSGYFLEVYRNYFTHLIDRPNVLVLLYREMIADYAGWLQRLIDHAGFTPRPETLKQLLENSPRKVKEDPTRHIRQVTPGDYRRKLKPETVQKLNALFAPYLERLGIPVEADHAESSVSD